MANGVQVLIISRASGMALTLPVVDSQHLPPDGTRIQQQSPSNRSPTGTLPGQAWTLVPADSVAGVFKIVSALTKKVLDVRGASTADGAVIQQFHDHGSENQQWKLVLMDTTVDPTDPTSPTQFDFTIMSVNSLKVLDVPLNQVEQDGTFIQQYTYNGGTNQRWTVAYTPPFGPEG